MYTYIYSLYERMCATNRQHLSLTARVAGTNWWHDVTSQPSAQRLCFTSSRVNCFQTILHLSCNGFLFLLAIFYEIIKMARNIWRKRCVYVTWKMLDIMSILCNIFSLARLIIFYVSIENLHSDVSFRCLFQQFLPSFFHYTFRARQSIVHSIHYLELLYAGLGFLFLAVCRGTCWFINKALGKIVCIAPRRIHHACVIAAFWCTTNRCE